MAPQFISSRCLLVTEAVGADRIEDLLDVFSRNRNGQPQPIVEVQL